MPADEQGRGGQARIARVMLWCGAALAPVAALLVMAAEASGLLRLAVVLVVFTVVLVGAAFMLMQRDGGAAVSADIEDFVLDEIDAMREDVRGDITHAAKTTHKALAEKIVSMNDTIEELRGQVDLLLEQRERSGYPAKQPTGVAHGVAPRPAPGGVLRHTETVHVTTRKTTVVDQNDEPAASGGTVYGHRQDPQPSHGARGGGHRQAAHGDDEYPARGGQGDRSRGSDHYAGRAADEQPAPWARVPHQRRADRQEPVALPASTEGPSWTDQLLGGQREDRGRMVEDASSQRWSRDADDLVGPGVTGLRSGDRWASVRSDDHGRELRMGERSSEIRATGSGSEYRIEDRWAAVRRDEPFGSRHDGSDSDLREHSDGWSDNHPWETTVRGSGPAALPAGESRNRSSWSSGWDEAEPAPEREEPRNGGYGGGHRERASGRERDRRDREGRDQSYGDRG
ncbi:MAG: hypothetical protein JXA67_03685, partial [Micromonosporaceae bacterium]|nr:hypothetical protein [Micromonosporaceae bacterium]